MKNLYQFSQQEVANAIYATDYQSFTTTINANSEFTQALPLPGATSVSFYCSQPVYYAFTAGVTGAPDPNRHYFEGGRLSFMVPSGLTNIYFRPVSYTTQFNVEGIVG